MEGLRDDRITALCMRRGRSTSERGSVRVVEGDADSEFEGVDGDACLTFPI
jgi:hypothetical protein